MEAELIPGSTIGLGSFPGGFGQRRTIRCPRTGLTMMDNAPPILMSYIRPVPIPDGSWPTGCKYEYPDRHIVEIDDGK
jgi:hypothetical protein